MVRFCCCLWCSVHIFIITQPCTIQDKNSFLYVFWGLCFLVIVILVDGNIFLIVCSIICCYCCFFAMLVGHVCLQNFNFWTLQFIYARMVQQTMANVFVSMKNYGCRFCASAVILFLYIYLRFWVFICFLSQRLLFLLLFLIKMFIAIC